jgi:hypothetical protein
MQFRWIMYVFVTLCLSFGLTQACGKQRVDPPGTENPPTTDGSPKPDVTTNPPDNTTNPPDTRTIPDPTPPPNTSCASIFACAKTKGCNHFPDMTCLDQCATDEKVTGTGKTQFDALKSCMSTSCTSCTAGDGACLSDCVLKNCAAVYFTCATDDKSGANNCKQATDCVTACANDTDCVAKCFANTSKADQTLYSKAKTCAPILNNPASPKADRETCYRDTLACDCPGNQPGQGSGTCADYIKCVEPCGTDTCCVAKCRAQTNATVLAPADTFTLCAADKCEKACQPNDKSCQEQCVLEQCNSEFLACQCPGVGGPGTGTKDCNSGLKCSDNCNINDACCLAQCAASMKKSSYDKYLKFVKCLPKCGCASGDKKCLENCGQSKCSSEAIRCVTD